MREAGLDALFVTDPANVNYPTGYEGWSFYVHQGMLVTLDADPEWIGREMDETAEVVVEGLEAALDAVEPGVTAESVRAAWREVIAEHGTEKESRIGYACGLGYPPDWGEHTASLRPGDTTTLEEDMTFHLIPGIWYDEFGVEISETFRVAADGAETFADFPRTLFR